MSRLFPNGIERLADRLVAVVGPVSGEDLIGSPAKQQLIAAAEQPPHRLVQRVVEIGNTQPPCAKPVWSSSGPPGAWITPSSDWKREPMILRIDSDSALCGLNPGDVDLAHGHHRFECSLGRGLVRIAVGPQQGTWRDLPRKAPPILAP